MDVPVIMLEFQQSKSYVKSEVPQIQLTVGVEDSGAVLGGCRHARCCTSTSACSCSVSTRLSNPCRGAEADSHGSVYSISLLQSIDKVVYVLVVQVVQVSQVPVVEKTGGSHSCSSLRKSFRSRQFLDKVVACPVVCNNR